jgi:exodeoxyribonuclease-5
MKPSNAQAAALDRVARWFRSGPKANTPGQVFYLGGNAGSGKTTIAKLFAAGVDGRVEYCAFTGKAAHVLRSKGCAGATTIHKLIYASGGDPPTPQMIAILAAQLEAARVAVPLDEAVLAVAGDRLTRAKEDANRKGPRFRLNPFGPAHGAALIIADECSMIDARTGLDLLSFGIPLLVLGDPAQLPPVAGLGFFTQRDPDFMLTEIHRQAADSPILRLATMIRHGKRPELGSFGEGVDVMRYGDYRIEERALAADQLLVGRNATRHGTNNKIRRLRGMAPGPVPGDRLICLRNDHELGLLNGGMHRCVAATPDHANGLVHLVVRDSDDDGDEEREGGAIGVTAWLHHFEGREKDLKGYTKNEAHEFAYGYAITVHKSQGSEFGNVVVFDESKSFGHDAHRHLYTAVTRARRELTLVL